MGMNSPYQSPAVKTGRNTRFRRDRQADIDQAAAQPGRDSSQLIRYGADLMLRSIRCGRCDEAVPLVLGDTSGRDMYDWMEAADRAILRQKHGGHTPVLVGAETGSQAQDGDGEDEDAATTGRSPGVRTEPPAPASPAAEEVIPDATVKRLGPQVGASLARQIASEVPGVGLASELAGGGGGPTALFRSPDPADEPYTPPPVHVPAPASRAKKGLNGTRCSDGGPHPVNRRIGDTCGKCGKKVKR